MTALAPMTRIVDLDLPPGRTATIARQSFGPVHLVHLQGFDYGQLATARTTDGVPAGISLGVRPRGTWTLSQGEITRGSVTGDVLGVVDVTRAMRLDADADTELLQLYVSADQLGMSVDALRAAVSTIERSPLRSLVVGHVLGLPRDDTVELAAAVRQSVGHATVELIRAMLIAAVRPEVGVGTEMSAHLTTCIKGHIRRHLHDPGLVPARIAEAHAISLRQLYNVWKGEDATVARWIVLQRLAAVREGLADPRLAHRSIAAIGRQCGLTNPTYLARRFQEEYGLTPREWRRLAGEVGSPGQNGGGSVSMSPTASEAGDSDGGEAIEGAEGGSGP